MMVFPRQAVGLVLTLLALAIGGTLLALDAPPADAVFTDSDADGFADIAEDVFGSGPNDADSVPEAPGYPYIFDEPICVDGVDNDLDGTPDRADPGCFDTDGDGYADEVERQFGALADDLFSRPESSVMESALISIERSGNICANGDDDDGDGLTDAADLGCTDIDADSDGFSDLVEKESGSNPESAASVPEHEPINDGSCSDAKDNDLDGEVDTADPGCSVLANDDLQNALLIGDLPFTHATKVLDATIEFEEPESDCLRGPQLHTAWYRYTPSQDRVVVLDTIGSDYGTVITVWREDAFSLTQVSCATAFTYMFDPVARVSFQAEADQNYFVQVAADAMFHVGTGRLVLNATVASLPANDDFADAAPITSLPFDISVDTIAATVEPHEPAASCAGTYFTVQNSVWYEYTPAIDTHIRAEATGFLGATAAVYTRGEDGSLTQVACSEPINPFVAENTAPLVFLAEANEIYYFQVGDSQFLQPPASRKFLSLSLSPVTLPSCPATEYIYQDPVGDSSFGDTPIIDIERLSATASEGQLCLALDLREPVDPRHAQVDIWVDADSDRATGFGPENCGKPSGSGFETVAFYDPEAGLLVSVLSITNQFLPPAARDGVGWLEDDVFNIALPVGPIDGDATLRFLTEADSNGDTGSNDCAPNGGNITCVDGICAFHAFRNGDADCAAGTNAIDAALVLQHSAGLLPAIPCPDAADVDGNDIIDSRDAALILQFTAGLLDQLPRLE